MNTCLRCQSKEIIKGYIFTPEGARGIYFDDTPLLKFILRRTKIIENNGMFYHCLKCQFVWSEVSISEAQ